MRFTLIYRGPLPSTGSARQKHELRRQLHPQLKELWSHAPLASFGRRWLSDEGREARRAIRQTGDNDFAVLVTSDLALIAEIDVLLLRPEHPGAILQGADIDNRLKTLFDALRYPDNPQEVPSDWRPTEDEAPLFCLLEDDRLITRVNVETARLLGPSQPDEVALTVRVQVRASRPTLTTSDLIS